MNHIATKQELSNKEIIDYLSSIGRIKKNSAELKTILKEYATYDNKKIRYLAIKNLAKLQDVSLIDFFYNAFKNEMVSDIKKECISGLGRLRNKKSIPILIELLQDDDPEIVTQSLRGLLYFKENKKVLNELEKSKNHSSEIIQDFIRKELKTKVNKSMIPHYESPKYLHNVIVNEDVLKILPLIKNESIHLTFTSPPYYNARDYSIYKSYNEYLEFLEHVFKETHRITKEGRFLIVNTSPIIIPRISRKHSSRRYPIPYDLHPLLVKMGWEFIDDIIWEKPEASVKNRNGGFYQYRKPLSYKPNARTESIMVYRKKTDKLLDWNIKQYSTDIVEKSKVTWDYETSNVWNIDPVYDKIHSAVFPIKLCDWIIQLYSFHGDLVFDPFGGSGTMAISSIKNTRKYFLTEQSKEYFERMKKRIDEHFDGAFDFMKHELNTPIFYETLTSFKKTIK